MEKREIKFRAWDGKIMREVRSLHNLHSQVNVHADLCALDNEKPPAVIEFRHDLILMQYTGLKDNNDKEIYEGDIVQVGNRNQVVSWLDEGAQFITMNSKDGVTNDDSGEWDIMTAVEHYGDYVIVGNIYENLDLLKA